MTGDRGRANLGLPTLFSFASPLARNDRLLLLLVKGAAAASAAVSLREKERRSDRERAALLPGLLLGCTGLVGHKHLKPAAASEEQLRLN